MLVRAPQLGGSPHIHAGEERFRAPKEASPITTRFSAGSHNQRALP